MTRRLVVYSKPDCPLCDILKVQLDNLDAGVALEIEVVDITTDAHLEEAFRLEVPVLFVDGRKAAVGRIEDAELVRILEDR